MLGVVCSGSWADHALMHEAGDLVHRQHLLVAQNTAVGGWTDSTPESVRCNVVSQHERCAVVHVLVGVFVKVAWRIHGAYFCAVCAELQTKLQNFERCELLCDCLLHALVPSQPEATQSLS
jgi:hypothetical protein